jgi:glycine cleavage system H protein
MEKGVAVIGMDEFLARMLGAVESVLLPVVGAAVAPAKAEISLSSGTRKIRLASPVEGRVMEVNTGVLSNPAIARRDPYGSGWFFKVSPAVRVPVSGSLAGAAAGEWLRTQMDLAKEFLTSASGGRSGALITTLPDGGTPADGALMHCDAAAWEEFERRFTTIGNRERATQ